MANDKKSPKGSKDKDNSVEDIAEAEAVVEADAKQGDAESSEDQQDDTALVDDAVASDVSEDATIVDADTIEDAEVIAEDGELLEALSEAKAEDVPAAETPAAEPTSFIQEGPSTFGLVAGGIIAGAIGFLVATFAVPEGWPNPPADPNDAMQAAIDSQADQIEALVAQIAALENAPAPDATAMPADVDLSPVQNSLADLSGRLDALSGELSAAAERVAALENAPAPEQLAAPAPDVDFDAEMETFRAELEAAAAAARAEVEAAQARADEIEAEAQAAAAIALQRAALAEVAAALESGAPFVAALNALPTPPDALVSVAGEGVPTLAALRAAFPDAARGALQEAQDVPADASATERMAAFLRKQTNARSLSPREGEDPDAILSRAEAALNSGDLTSALSELSGLSPEASQSLSDWISQAETRVAATSAAQSLRDELN